MFDFAWSEIALIGAVALVLIGPKDMPVAIKAITTAIKRARKMAAEFQGHVDEMVREADLHEVRDQVREIRSMDLRGALTRAVDGDGALRKALQDPIRTPPPVVTTPVEALPEHTIAAPAEAGPAILLPKPAEGIVAREAPPPPAFIPPAFVPPAAAEAAAPAQTHDA